MTVWTVGHRTRTVEDLVAALQSCAVTLLVDVRTIPRSRHNPQFNREALLRVLAEAGIGYTHLPQLGGLRRPRRDSTNTAWRSSSFRGYADHMQTEDFQAGLHALLGLAEGRRTAIMCAEHAPARCHRSLISDALCAHGVDVEHMLEQGHVERHALTAWARLDGDRVTYPGATPERDLFAGLRDTASGEGA